MLNISSNRQRGSCYIMLCPCPTLSFYSHGSSELPFYISQRYLRTGSVYFRKFALSDVFLKWPTSFVQSSGVNARGEGITCTSFPLYIVNYCNFSSHLESEKVGWSQVLFTKEIKLNSVFVFIFELDFYRTLISICTYIFLFMKPKMSQHPSHEQ